MAALLCFACRNAPRDSGLLCASCREGLVVPALCPEQLTARLPGPLDDKQNAWLIDGFGMPHTVAVEAGGEARLGRSRAADVVVAERTVSQRHALLEHRARSGVWFLLDEGSDNGTFVGEDRVERRFPLEPLDRVFLGRNVGLLFVPLDGDLEAARRELRWLKAQAPSLPTRVDLGPQEEVRLRILAVPEGGALALWGEERAQLSELEYELLLVLHRRHREEAHLDPAVRGFVPASALLDALSFQTGSPTHNNLRVLVRKLRRKLAEREPPVDVIESRQGLGYRLARELEID